MTKRQYLYLQRRSRPEQSDQRQPNQAANISRQPRASPNSTPLASRIEFPTMTAETASETLLPYRLVSPHPNLVTEAGLKALEFQLHQAHEAYETAQKIEDVNERRRQAASPLRDARYFAARVRTAQVITNPTSTDTVAFGNTVTFRRDDGRVQKYHIVGEDEADPKAGSISFVSPVARLLMGKAVGDVAGGSGQELEIIAIA